MSQSDSCAITKEIDKFDGKTKYETGFVVMHYGFPDKIYANAYKVGSSVQLWLSITSDSYPCFKKGSKLILLFSDDSKSELINDEDLNCKGSFTVNCHIEGNRTNNEGYNSMMNKTVKSIRFYTTEGYVDYDLNWFDNKTLAESFRHKLECLVITN